MKIKQVLPFNYSEITEIFYEGKHQYWMFKLPEEKSICVVLRGVSDITITEEPQTNLTDLGFEIISLSRIHKMKKAFQRIYDSFLFNNQISEIMRQFITCSNLNI